MAESSKIADAFVEIGARTSKFNKGMAGVRQRLSKIGRGFKSLAKTASIAFLAIGASAIFLGKKVIDASSSFENLEVRLVTFLGSQKKATEAMEFFVKQAEKVPFSLEQVAEAGTTLTAMGADFRKWLPLATDVAAVMGVDLVTAASQLGRAFAGGAGAADVFREKGILNIIRESKGIRDLSKLTLPEFRKAMFDAFVDPQGKIAGAAKGLSKTWTGQLSMVGDSVFKLKKELGDVLLPQMKELVTFTIKPLINEWIEWVKANENLVKEDIAFHVNNIKNAIEFLGDAIRFVLKQYETFRNVFILGSLNMRKKWITLTSTMKKTFVEVKASIKQSWAFITTDSLGAIDKIEIAWKNLNVGFLRTIATGGNKIRAAGDKMFKALGLSIRSGGQEPLTEFDKALLETADTIEGEILKIAKPFLDMEDDRLKKIQETKKEQLAVIKKEAKEENKVINGLIQSFLKAEEARKRNALLASNAINKNREKNEEKFTKKVKKETTKRNAIWVGLADIWRKAQEAALGIGKENLAAKVNRVLPGVKGDGAIAAKDTKEQIDIAKEQTKQLKNISKTLLTRDFVSTAPMG